MPKKKDRYILKKFVFATSTKEAIGLDSKAPVVECYIDADYIKEKKEFMASAIGYQDNDKSYQEQEENDKKRG